VCRSPFTEDRTPSFFVRLVKGEWLFKDFSSGAAGTIFDFVTKKEGLGRFADALKRVRGLVGGLVYQVRQGTGAEAERPYDVQEMYKLFRNNDPQVCRDYLLRRGIDAEIVDEMIADGTILHNEYQGRSYCCFVVKDEAGQIRCLDNHAIEGDGKFVLGKKSVFTLEWEALKQARVVFLCEGVIDYLSVKSLEVAAPPGLALLGNQLCFEAVLLSRAAVLLSAMDDDRGGYSAILDLKERYPDKEVRVYDLEGYKDPNELLLAARSGKGRKLGPQRKLQLYREFQQAENKADIARRWGIDRSYMYEVVRDCEQALIEAFAERKRGRPQAGAPKTLQEALERIKELESQYEREATEREELLCRSEFLAIRLKYAEIEAAELRGETVDEQKGAEKKPQIKKKKNSRP
jgi:DNA primase